MMHDGVKRNSCRLGDMVATKFVVVIWSCGSSVAEQDRDRLA